MTIMGFAASSGNGSSMVLSADSCLPSLKFGPNIVLKTGDPSDSTAEETRTFLLWSSLVREQVELASWRDDLHSIAFTTNE